MNITLATSNPHKVVEMNEINTSPEITFVSVPEGFDPIENGKTFEENAIIKAKEAAKISGNYSLADDSGLMIEALNGAPGLYSARYAASAKERIARVLKELKDCKNRKAKFVCSTVLVSPEGEILFKSLGEMHGEIAFEPAGTEGFGYDPIFYLPEYGKTVAELDNSLKNKISHRAKSLVPMLNFIEQKGFAKN